MSNKPGFIDREIARFTKDGQIISVNKETKSEMEECSHYVEMDLPPKLFVYNHE